mmetsp:Transcript_18905/g.37207  ORF Transcript_18905/g.37207 Transcript_18905/m.37207 type:complete len:213 (+) Transcript_18905:656-1294(+)
MVNCLKGLLLGSGLALQSVCAFLAPTSASSQVAAATTEPYIASTTAATGICKALYATSAAVLFSWERSGLFVAVVCARADFFGNDDSRTEDAAGRKRIAAATAAAVEAAAPEQEVVFPVVVVTVVAVVMAVFKALVTAPVLVCVSASSSPAWVGWTCNSAWACLVSVRSRAVVGVICRRRNSASAAADTAASVSRVLGLALVRGEDTEKYCS